MSRGQENGIDQARRNAGDDVEPGRWKMASETAKHAHLRGRAGTAAGQYESKRIGNARHEFRRLYILRRRILSHDDQIRAFDLH